MKTIQMPYSKLSRALGLEYDVYLKREDQHKYGSHKGRSIPLMIKKYFKEDNITKFVISSSGNAAIAAVYAVQAHNRNNPIKIKLTIFIGQNINPDKLKILLTIINDPNIKLEQVEKPKQRAFQMDKSSEAKLLRQSTDDKALEGYLELAEELIKIPNLSAVFIPTSSGTTAEGLGNAFLNFKKNIQIHIVQTTSCHPMIEMIEKTKTIKEKSLADAIVDKIAYRKENVAKIIEQTNGHAWIASNQEIKEVIELIKNTCQTKISNNSALSVVGLKQALEKKWKFSGPVACLITGT
ncbi:MAG TPA: PLP-dependent lyase/thiolase [Candidatus Magasanikbacteria bacterium]|jgi:threonine dehydratase|nr:PLP-dependent lyase/thiolase [Candidatus Magasanikbacteria bacterium]